MTTPSYRLINPPANRSFVFKWEPFDLTTRWHYHPEVELIFFIEGKTSGVIGEGFKEFEEGDLVILGSNFPHVLQENQEFAQANPQLRPFGLIIQFLEHFLGEEFMQKPELAAVRQLLRKAQRGLKFGPKARARVSPALLDMPQQNDLRKLLTLLEVLTMLAETDDYQYLTPQDYAYDHSQDEERMCQINQFVYRHFTEKISLADVAAVANLTETSFCRYFKSRTLKSFTRFLNEVRIAYACKLLKKPNYSVSDACFESGFGSLSYFTRQFKSVMHLSPQEYQRRKLEKGADKEAESN